MQKISVARGGALHNSAPLSAQRERGVSVGMESAAAEAAATGVGVSRFCCELAGVCPGRLRGWQIGGTSCPALALRRARGWIAERAFAHPGKGWRMNNRPEREVQRLGESMN